MVLVDCQLTGHEPLSAVVGELDSVDAAKVAEHVLLEEAAASRQPAPLEVLLHERLPGELSAGQEAHGGAHTAAIQLLHGSPEPNLETHAGRGPLSSSSTNSTTQNALILRFTTAPWASAAVLQPHYGGLAPLSACQCRRLFRTSCVLSVVPAASSQQQQPAAAASCSGDGSLLLLLLPLVCQSASTV